MGKYDNDRGKYHYFLLRLFDKLHILVSLNIHLGKVVLTASFSLPNFFREDLIISFPQKGVQNSEACLNRLPIDCSSTKNKCFQLVLNLTFEEKALFI